MRTFKWLPFRPFLSQFIGDRLGSQYLRGLSWLTYQSVQTKITTLKFQACFEILLKTLKILTKLRRLHNLSSDKATTPSKLTFQLKIKSIRWLFQGCCNLPCMVHDFPCWKVHRHESIFKCHVVEIRLLWIYENGVRDPNLFHIRTNQLDGGIFMVNSGHIESWIDPELKKVEVYLKFLKMDRRKTLMEKWNSLGL